MPETPPNVLLVCTDHWPANLLGSAGHPAVLTPTLDQLAANGARFSSAYADCPVCVASRRSLMSGMHPSRHGSYRNAWVRDLPEKTLAQCFRDAGYQAYAVGKMHIKNMRGRLGFDDILCEEEGRAATTEHGADDYELFLGDQGYAGQRFASGACNNEYFWRPWHLPEHLHPTNWAADQMCRVIQRRDRTRPAFWYLSFSHPHPPLQPLSAYMDVYRTVEPPPVAHGDWANEPCVAVRRMREPLVSAQQIADTRRAFYALCTHIDHQLRRVIGTIREAGLANDTIIVFTSDHGDMLGDHGIWGKTRMYDGSAGVPMIISGVKGDVRVGEGRTFSHPVATSDIMPTLLDLAGLPVPEHVSGRSMFSPEPRKEVYSVFGMDSRMVRDEAWKLVYLPEGNVCQLFDMRTDRVELHNRAADPACAEVLTHLRSRLLALLSDEERAAWAPEGQLRGVAEGSFEGYPTQRGFRGQRGSHWPLPGNGPVKW